MNSFSLPLKVLSATAIISVAFSSSAIAAKRKAPVTNVSSASTANIVQVQAPATPTTAPLAGLNFLILALDDIDPTQITRPAAPATSGPTLPLVPTDGFTSRVAPPSVPTVSIVPRKSAAPPIPPTEEQPAPAPDTGHPPASIRRLKGDSQGVALGSAWWRGAARYGFQFIATPREPILKPGPEPRSPAAEKAPLVPFGQPLPAGNVPAPAVTGSPTASSAEGDNFSSLAPTTRISRAQGAAVPLRRALLKAGCVDVMTTGADGAPILRVLNSHRLSLRTIQILQDGMGQLMVAGKTTTNDENVRSLIRSASRVGQALGYRGVIVVALLPRAAANSNGVATPTVEATYGVVIADAMREKGEPLVFDEKGVDDGAMHESAALTERAIIEKIAVDWTPVTADEKRQASLNYLNQARDLLAQTAVMQANPAEATRLQNEAVDTLNQSLAMDVNQIESYVMLGDLLAVKDASGAASEYNRAAQLKPTDGKVWTKVAIAYTKGGTPDWPHALEAAKRALALGYEAADLHLAYAVTQWGRAAIFRRYNAEDRAVAAETDARTHLDRALLLAPQDDPGVMRDIASQLVAQGRYKEGVSVLEKMTKLYPTDKEIQILLAQSLLNIPNQEEGAFGAWAKVWKTQNTAQVTLDPAQYAFIIEGFDRNVASIGKEASRLASGVAQAGVPREQALLQMMRLRDDLNVAQETIKIMVPPTATQRLNHNSRIFAIDLMSQAFGNYIMFLETADTTMFNRATDLHRQAMVTLNLVRATK